MFDLCIYHGNCADGFGAAWVVKQVLSDIAFHGGVYQTPPPDVTGKNVVLVDFSYKRNVILEMAAKTKSILILDHHKSAIEDLVDLPNNVQTVFDVKRSGAMITWNYFFPNLNPPRLIEHIQDRDLWKFAIPGTREIQANVFSYPYDFDIWNELMNTDTEVLIVDGTAIERKHHKDIAELVAVTKREMLIAGYYVPVANLPHTYSSDAGYLLLTQQLDAAFAACYWDTESGRVFSLRSENSRKDVSEIAKLYGGGGHRNAAGFTVPLDHELGKYV